MKVLGTILKEPVFVSDVKYKSASSYQLAALRRYPGVTILATALALFAAYLTTLPALIVGNAIDILETAGFTPAFVSQVQLILIGHVQDSQKEELGQILEDLRSDSGDIVFSNVIVRRCSRRKKRDRGNILPHETGRIQTGTGIVGKVCGLNFPVYVLVVGLFDEGPELGIVFCGQSDQLVSAPDSIHVYESYSLL